MATLIKQYVCFILLTLKFAFGLSGIICTSKETNILKSQVFFDGVKCRHWCRTLGYDTGDCYLFRSLTYAADCECNSFNHVHEGRLNDIFNNGNASDYIWLKMTNRSKEKLFYSSDLSAYKDAGLNAHYVAYVTLLKKDTLVLEDVNHKDLLIINATKETIFDERCTVLNKKPFYFVSCQ